MTIGQAALADGPYYGVGAAIYSATSNEEPDGGGDDSTDTYGAIGGTLGYRWDQPTAFFGAELDADFAFNTDFENDGVPCSTSASVRPWAASMPSRAWV